MQVAAAGLRQAMPEAAAHASVKISGSAEHGLYNYDEQDIELHTTSEDSAVTASLQLVVENMGIGTRVDARCQAVIADRAANHTVRYVVGSINDRLWLSADHYSQDGNLQRIDALSHATPADIVRLARLVMAVATDNITTVR